MDITNLYTDLKDALDDSSSIDDWAQITYSKDHTFIERPDQRNAPGESECPCCTLWPIGKTMDSERSVQFASFNVVMMVHDESDNGFDNLEAYRGHVQDVLESQANTDNLFLVDMLVDYDIQSGFPFLICDMQLKFKQYFVIGQSTIE